MRASLKKSTSLSLAALACAALLFAAPFDAAMAKGGAAQATPPNPNPPISADVAHSDRLDRCFALARQMDLTRQELIEFLDTCRR